MKARRTQPLSRSESKASLLKRLRQAERRVRELERRYELVLAAAKEGFYDWNIARNTIHYSERVHSYLGLPPGTLKTTDDWVNRIHPDDLPIFRAAYRAHFKGLTPRLECDYRFRGADDSWRWARTHGVAIRNRSGSAVRVIGTSSDITEFKEHERQLAEQKAILQTTLENIDQGITLVDEHLRTTVLNRRFLELLRYPPEQFKPGFPMEEALRYNAARGEYGTDPDEIERRIRERQMLARRGEPHAFERSHPDGTLVAIRRKRLPAGGFVATYTDVTKQRRAQEQLEQALAVQTATAETLRAVAQLRNDLQPVFDVIVRNAVQLCDARVGCMFRFDGELIHLVATHDFTAEALAYMRTVYPMRPNRSQLAGRSILTGSVQRIEDVALDTDYATPVAAAGGWRRILTVPMMRDGKPLGVIGVTWADAGSIPDRQVELLQTFADQAVIAMESARLFNRIQDSLAEQTAIADVLRVMSESPLDFTPVFETILRHAVDLCGAQHGIAFRFDGALQHIVAQHNYSPEADRVARTMYPGPPRRDQASGRAILDRAVQRVENAQALPGGATQLAATGGWNRILSVPMLHHGRALGTVSVSWEQAGEIPESRVKLLKTFADEAAIAVENVRLFNETREALAQQRALAEVLGTISASVADTQPVLDKILDSCQRLFAGHVVGVTLLGSDGLIRLGAYRGENKDAMDRVYPVPLARDSGSGLAMLDQKVVHFADVDAPESNAPPYVIRGAATVGMKTIVFAPLIAEGRSIGALWVGRHMPDPFSERQVALLKTFADQAVIAIQNTSLFREIQDKSEQLEVANRHKSEFLANMSHELRTPLNAIIGFTRIVMRRSQGELDPKQYDNLGKILASGQHLLSLINAILDLAKVEAGHVEVHPEEVSLAPVLEQCMRTVEPLVKTEVVTLTKVFDGELPQVYVDEEKLRQIVFNLLSNAAKFTNAGSIRLHASAANGSLAIAVADTGSGIPAEKLGVIFEQFEQLDTANTRSQGGTGLGLAISRRLARLMGGDIHAQSTLGAGSTFTLTLPTRYRPLDA